MRETQLDIAYSNWEVSSILTASNADDENILNHAAYHLQQAVELALKYVLEQNGVSYPKTHDIEILLKAAKDNQIFLSKFDWIYEHAEMLSSWEAKTRYIVAYLVEKNKIMNALPEVHEFLSAIKELQFTTERDYDQDELSYMMDL